MTAFEERDRLEREEYQLKDYIRNTEEYIRSCSVTMAELRSELAAAAMRRERARRTLARLKAAPVVLLSEYAAVDTEYRGASDDMDSFSMKLVEYEERRKLSNHNLSEYKSALVGVQSSLGRYGKVLRFPS